MAERKAAELSLMGQFPAGHWLEVVSLRDHVLGPFLFLICINDLDSGISGIILKFADDTKFMGKVGKVDEIKKLRGDLKKLLGLKSGKWFSMQTSVRFYILVIIMGKFIMLWMVIYLNLLMKNWI